MDVYIALDVSLASIAICILGADSYGLDRCS